MLAGAKMEQTQEQGFNDQPLLEQIDQQSTNAKIDAKCHCHKLNTGYTP